MKRIVIHSFDTYGDMVLRQPLFKSLCDEGYEVSLLARRPYDEIVRYLEPRIQQVFTTNTNTWEHTLEQAPREFDALIETVKDWRPDIMLCPVKNPNWLNYGILQRVPCARKVVVVTDGNHGNISKRTCGFRAQIKTVEAEYVVVGERESEYCAYEQIAAWLTGKSLQPYSPRLTIGNKEIQSAQDTLQKLNMAGQPYVISNPAGISGVKIKAWPLDTYVPTMVKMARQSRWKILLTGIEMERDYLQRAVDGLSSHGIQASMWIGETSTLGTLLGLVSGANAYAGGDTGLMHFAAAFNKPVLAVFGGGTWGRFLPLADKRIIVTQHLPCASCDWDCEYAEPFCLTSITRTQLAAAVDKLLDNRQFADEIDTGIGYAPVMEQLVVQLKQKKKQEIESLEIHLSAANRQLVYLNRKKLVGWLRKVGYLKSKKFPPKPTFTN